MPQHENRLIRESSPYLRQHAHNPVDWYPWGDEAFARARAENKPVFLSVGYSACHWCHVMERESFENEAIARVMNELFVNVKVDREERPDVDHIYMSAVQMLTGRGGWPMSVFLTPEGEPFYGGTYFPPEDRHGMPGFPRLLEGISRAWNENPDQIGESVTRLMDALRRVDDHRPADHIPGDDLVVLGAQQLARAYDDVNGGIGQAPKFPNESVFELFARVHDATGDERFLEMFLHTLRRMAHGGIYDQLGGGFHRYSVDERWLVPHFEKMLYDNALLAPLYVDAFRITGDGFFARIARETLDYVLREMRDANGGFWSTQDADSEGEEGKFFVWTADEVRALVDPADFDLVCRWWDITAEGNFEHKNILHVTLEFEQLAKLFQREPADAEAALAKGRTRLLAARDKRVHPGLDDKILTSWNGLMISAFARAAEVFHEPRFREAAVGAVAFIEKNLQQGDRLLGTWKDGVARLNGYLDDYAFFIGALLDVFELTQERAYLDRAEALTRATLEHFLDADAGGSFFTSDDHEDLIVRTKPTFDGSIPSGNSVMARNLLRLHHLTGADVYRDRAEDILRLYADAMRQQPFGMANLVCALDFYVQTPKDVVIVGAHEDAQTQALLDAVRQVYLPNRTLTLVDPERGEAVPEILAGKGRIDGRATAYVCQRMTCSAPVTDPAALLDLLQA
jgi:uncharacterized protein YyaL (SSP411 family)